VCEGLARIVRALGYLMQGIGTGIGGTLAGLGGLIGGVFWIIFAIGLGSGAAMYGYSHLDAEARANIDPVIARAAQSAAPVMEDALRLFHEVTGTEPAPQEPRAATPPPSQPDSAPDPSTISPDSDTAHDTQDTPPNETGDPHARP
jgi:predicted lipid-binding transport protein (Tim44 family)